MTAEAAGFLPVEDLFFGKVHTILMLDLAVEVT